jgi:long-chain fatty acid transport protein
MRFTQNLSLLTFILFTTFNVQASGFALMEQSASGQGLSYAGAGANTEDASVMWFNPAGLTDIKGSQLIMGAHIISPQAKFTNNGTTGYTSPGTVGTLSGPNNDGTKRGVVPNFFWAKQFGDYHAGLSVTVPFGQEITYQDNWVGRYFATKTDLKTVNINPSISRKLGDKWAFGVGLNAQYVELTLAQKVNNKAVSGDPDGNANVNASSWGYGYNLGMLFTPTVQTKIGVAYRSKITHHAKGTVQYTGVNATLAGFKHLVNGNVSSTVNLPASLSFSVDQSVNPKLQLLASATLTKWSGYKELVVHYDQGQATGNTNQDFKDSWHYALGGMYQLNDDWKLRTGIALDKTPISNPTHRSPRTPDTDRKWISMGFGYKMSAATQLDVGYSHLFSDKSNVNYSTDSGTTTLKGSYTPSVDVFSAQLVWRY